MKQRSAKQTVPVNPRAAVVKRIMSIANLIRERGTPEEADEAVEWERKLLGRLNEIEGEEQEHKQAA